MNKIYFSHATSGDAKTLAVPIEKTFDIPAHVLSHIMRGQWWPDGDEMYHSWIATPTLLVYGRNDKLVRLWEEEEMHKVSN